MCGVERHICGVPAEGAQVTDPPPPRGGGRALTITLHPDLEHKKHFQSLSFGLFGYLFVWGASSEILTAASLSFLLCEREVMLRAAQESCWA